MVNRINIGAKGTKLDYDNWGLPITQAVNEHDIKLLALDPAWVSVPGTAWQASGVNPSLGNGTLTSHYRTLGTNLILFTFQIIAGTTTTFGTGTYFITVPFPATSDSVNEIVGSCYLLDAGTLDKIGQLKFEDTSKVTPVAATGGVVTPTNPHTMAVNDRIRGTILYGI